MPITHAKVSGVAPTANPNLVSSTDWNAAHVGSSTDATAPHLLGPFHIAFDDAGIGFEEDGLLLVALAQNTLVLSVIVRITTVSGFDAHLDISIGGPNYASPNDDFGQLCRILSGGGALGGTGYWRANGHVAGNPEAGMVTGANGALVAQLNDVATQGEADIYALVVSP